MSAPPAGPAVTGYRTLTDSDIALMNRIKAKEADAAELVALVRLTVPAGEPQRQCALAVTAFEEAFMRLVRAVAQPVNPFVRHAAPAAGAIIRPPEKPELFVGPQPGADTSAPTRAIGLEAAA